MQEHIITRGYSKENKRLAWLAISISIHALVKRTF